MDKPIRKEEKHMGYPGEHPVAPILRRRVYQFLVHSYLYYELNESIIDDHQYDMICKELSELVEEFPEMEVPHIDLARGVGTSGSGFYIQNYPPNIITTAFRQLWYNRKENNPNFNENFEQFIGRWGRKLDRR
jgi:hypothetical protein